MLTSPSKISLNWLFYIFFNRLSCPESWAKLSEFLPFPTGPVLFKCSHSPQGWIAPESQAKALWGYQTQDKISFKGMPTVTYFLPLPPSNVIDLWIHQWINTLRQSPNDPIAMPQWLDPQVRDQAFSTWAFSGTLHIQTITYEKKNVNPAAKTEILADGTK